MFSVLSSTCGDVRPTSSNMPVKCPVWVELFKSGSSRVVDFFLGLSAESVDEAQADAFVGQVLRWGSLYPKLAQRLRLNKQIVKSDVLRHKLGRVMEGCTPRSEALVCEHVARHHCCTTFPEEITFIETLGTGSVAQVALFRVGEKHKVMKMTWPEDKAAFEVDFGVFAWWVSAGEFLRLALGGLSEKFLFFLNTVLAKQEDILKEFDLTEEAQFTMEGSALVEQCMLEMRPMIEGKGSLNEFCLKVPAAKLHSPHMLEQELAAGKSLESLLETRNYTTYRAAVAYSELFVPLLGHMLMHKGMAHADAHAGNLRFDSSTNTFWIIDWGAVVRLDEDRRQALSSLVTELSIGEVVPQDGSKALQASVGVARSDSPGPSFWQHCFHPAKYPLPSGLDFQELKDSLCHDPQLVLCLETIMMQSLMLSNLAEVAASTCLDSLGGAPVANLSLLRQWSTPASHELLVAVHTGVVSDAVEAIQRGQSLFATYLGSDETVLEAALNRHDAALTWALRDGWSNLRAPSDVIDSEVHNCPWLHSCAVSRYVNSVAVRASMRASKRLASPWQEDYMKFENVLGREVGSEAGRSTDAGSAETSCCSSDYDFTRGTISPCAMSEAASDDYSDDDYETLVSI